MYFEQQLEDVGYQYSLVTDPENYLADVLYERELPDSNEVQDIFRCTEVYNKLAFNPQDDEKLKNRKQEFVNAYIDILNSAGLALQSIIISDLDNLYKKDIKSADQKLIDYFDDGLFMPKVNAIFPSNENFISKASFIISEGNLSDKDLGKLKNIKDFFSDISTFNLSKIEYVKYDLSSQNFNYKNIEDILFHLYTSAEESVANETINNDAKLKLLASTKKAKLSEQEKPKRKILSLEEALDKNFENLIGLKDVKNAILGKTKLILKVPQKAIACNFRIIGNPGVGKTTVAEAMSKTFYDAGIIKNKEFVAINGAELKAEYVGQTTGRVKEFFRKAHGGTLFLDEVYSLLEEGSGDSFTQEAITQLMTEIESLYNGQLQDPTDKTLVIMAGYKDKVGKLLDKNIGFRRRFPNILELRDYNLEELLQIFKMYMEKDGFTLQKDANQMLTQIIEKEKKKENFSNAGYVRNLLQSAEENQARRTELNDFEIKIEDLIEAEKSLYDSEEENVGKIGF